MSPSRVLAIILLAVAPFGRTAIADEPKAAGVAIDSKPKIGDQPARLLLDQSISEYKTRRAALMARVKEAEANSGLFAPRNGDAKAPETVIALVGRLDEAEDEKFRQSNDFAYLSGVDTAHAAMILRPSTGKETLYLPPRNKFAESWTGPKIGPGPEGVATTGFDRVAPMSEFLGDLFGAIGDPGKRSPASRSGTVYLLEPEAGPLSSSSSSASASFAKLIREGATTTRRKDVGPMLGELRKVKSANEMALLRKAIGVTADAQAAAIAKLGPGVPEYRLEGAILGAFVEGGGTRAGFPSIVGSGPNSTILHYNANRRIMRDGDLVVIDIGGEYAYYTADITRTYPVSGKFSPRQREIYRLVLDCQSAAANEFKVGVSTLGSLNRVARDVFRKSLLRAKDASGNERSMDAFFTHGLGHYLGMDVHDVGDSAKPLGPGEVFTIEPGLYIPSEGLGVRIEDDYLVTKDGLEKLSKEIPSAPDDLERLIAKARESRSKAKRVAEATAP